MAKVVASVRVESNKDLLSFDDAKKLYMTAKDLKVYNKAAAKHVDAIMNHANKLIKTGYLSVEIVSTADAGWADAECRDDIIKKTAELAFHHNRGAFNGIWFFVVAADQSR